MIELQSVSKVFTRGDTSFTALEDISFQVETGHFTSIVGPSGCGKTTILKMTAGLMTPTRGSVRVDGQEVRKPGPDRAFVFQNFVLLPWADVLTNIAFGLEARGLGRREREEIARQQLQAVGLTGFERHYPHELSGGMQQRVGISRALAVDPQTLLMDEPFGALDAITRQLMQRDLLRLWQETASKTTMFVTHSMDEAALLSDRIVIMNTRPGRIEQVVDVPFPRPRDENLAESNEYRDFTTGLWHQLARIQREDMARETATP
jgi:NitT/TauT family transport system ATP-binding protein